MTRGRSWGYIALGVLVAALVGFILGWYQAYPAQLSRDRAMLRLRLSEARARTLDARVALSRANFGDARTHVQEAVRLLEAFKADGQSDLPPNEAAKVDEAAQVLREIDGLVVPTPVAAGEPPPPGDTQAETRAERAGNLLGEVYRATPEP